MTKVYRVVPSFPATFLKYIKIDDGLGKIEGEFYDLGYISFEHGYRFFKSSDECLNIYSTRSNELEKHFYLFPFDALWGAYYCIEKSCFSHYEWDLLEYDIPDEILVKYCGYGFYLGMARIEFCIPESELKNINTTKIDIEKLRNTLTKSFENYIDKFGKGDNKNRKDYKKAVEVAINVERDYYYSEFITKNRTLFCRDDLYLIDENNRIVDLLKNDNLVDVLEQKGIKCSKEELDIYNSLEKSSHAVYREPEKHLLELKNTLNDVLPQMHK